jgi:flagellar motor switch protein FliG
LAGLSNREKAAVLLIGMGKNQASQIYKYLSEEEIETLTLAITTTKRVNPEEQAYVMNEFYETCIAQKFVSEGGLDYARTLLIKSLGEEKANEILTKLTETLQVRPFEFMRSADPSHIVHIVSSENPQTIALLLSYLDSKKAALVLSELPGDIQVEVVERMANMESVVPEYIKEIERVLEQRLAQIGMSDQTNVGGIDAVVQLINGVDRGTERHILGNLDMLDPELAEKIRNSMFVFEDVVNLTNQAMQRVLEEIEQHDLAVALKSSPENVKMFIMGNLSKRRQEMLRDDMEVLGPTRMRDIESAQQKIVNAVRALEERGEIIVSRGEGDDMIV